MFILASIQKHSGWAYPINQSLQLIMKLITKVTHLLSTADEISHFMLQLPEVRMQEWEIFSCGGKESWWKITSKSLIRDNQARERVGVFLTSLKKDISKQINKVEGGIFYIDFPALPASFSQGLQGERSWDERWTYATGVWAGHKNK